MPSPSPTLRAASASSAVASATTSASSSTAANAGHAMRAPRGGTRRGRTPPHTVLAAIPMLGALAVIVLRVLARPAGPGRSVADPGQVHAPCALPPPADRDTLICS
jgi:hypothetical protein